MVIKLIMRNKIFFALTCATFFFVFVASFFIVRALHYNFEKAEFAHLKTLVEIIEKNENNFLANDFENEKKFRVTIISNDGKVLFENNFQAEKMENHFARKEIQSAREIGEGFAKRNSETLGEKFYYFAKKTKSGNIIRVAEKQKTLSKIFLSNVYFVGFFFLALFAIIFALSQLLSFIIVKPINALDVEHISFEKNYRELRPLLKKIVEQKNQLESDKANLEKLSLIRKEFTANVSHELKTPLQTISGYAELLKNGIAQKKDIVPFAEKIFSESFRMTQLVEDIIRLSELESEGKNIRFEETNVARIVQNVIDSLETIAEKKNISILFLITSETGEAGEACEVRDASELSTRSSPELLHTIIYNLIDNAIKYNKQNGKIFVEAKNENGAISIFVRDTGIGIESENISRIFERFFRVDKSRSKLSGGTGLGLSIVKHSAELIGATITVKSEFGKGSEFCVRLG